jgi:4-carboxymuconolactone decarboxylase
MDERQAKGIKDEMGKEASPVPADMNKDEYNTPRNLDQPFRW